MHGRQQVDEITGQFFRNAKPLCTEISSTLSNILRHKSDSEIALSSSLPLLCSGATQPLVAQVDALTDAIQKLREFLCSYWSTSDDESGSKQWAQWSAMDKCFDYVAFPLLLVLEQDYQNASRQSSVVGDCRQQTSFSVRCVEETVLCLKELSALARPGLPSRDHMIKFLSLLQALFATYLDYSEMERREREVLDRLKKNDAPHQKAGMLDASGELKSAGSRIVTEASSDRRLNSVASHEELKLYLVEWLQDYLRVHMCKYDIASDEFSSNQERAISERMIRPALALFISKLLDISRYEQSKELRYSALVCVDQLYRCIGRADILKDYFPGSVSSLYQVITGDYKHGFRAISAAIVALRTLTGIVCSDEHNSDILDAEPKRMAISLDSLRAESSKSSVPPESLNENVSRLGLLLEGLDLQGKGETGAASEEKEGLKDKHQPSIQEDPEPKVPKSWLQQLRENFNPLLSQLFRPTVFHRLHPAAQFEMLHLASTLLEKCSRTLDSSIPVIIEVVMMGSQERAFRHRRPTTDHQKGDSEDSHTTIIDQQEFAIQTIDKFKESLSQDGQPRIMSHLTNRFIDLISTVPSICSTGNTEEKAAHIVLLCSYINILGDHLQLILPSILERLSFALMVILEPNRSDMIRIVEQKSSSFTPLPEASSVGHKQQNDSHPGVLNVTPQFLFPKTHLLHIGDARTLGLMKSACNYLGRHGDLELLLDHFRGILNSPKSQRFHIQTVFIIQHMLIGAYDGSGSQFPSDRSTEQDQTLQMHIDSLLDDFFAPGLWNADEYIHAGAGDSEPASKGKKSNLQRTFDHILLSSAMLECIATFAMLMRDNFQVLLIRVLFHVLEKLGDEHIPVKENAFTALQMIAYYCGYGSSTGQTERERMAPVMKLIALNADYIIDDLVYHMKYLNLYPQAPFIMRALFETTERASTAERTSEESDGISLIGLIEDTQACIFSALDNFQFSIMARSETTTEKYLDCFFSILRSIINIVVARQEYRFRLSSKSHGPSSTGDDDEQSIASESEEEEVDVAQYFRNVHEKKARQLEENMESEDRSGSTDDSASEHSKEEQKETELVLQIMEKCQHFLGMRSLLAQNHVIDVISRAVDFFVQVDETGMPQVVNDKVLPAVHKIWSPLVTRLRLNRDRETEQNHSKMTIMRLKFLQLIEKLVASFPDFMYSKVTQDLWPVLQSTIIPGIDLLEYIIQWEQKMQDSISRGTRQPCQHIFEYATASPSFKLKLALVKLLERMTRPGSGNTFARLLSGARGSIQTYDLCVQFYAFLDERQPQQLQDCTTALFENLCKLDPDSVWYALVEMSMLPCDDHQTSHDEYTRIQSYLQQLSNPPHPDLSPVALPSISKTDTAESPLVQVLVRPVSGIGTKRLGKYKKQPRRELPIKGLRISRSTSRFLALVDPVYLH